MSKWKGINFIYNGISSQDMEVVLAKLNGDYITESDILGTYESYIDKTYRADVFNSMGGTYTNPIRTEFCIGVNSLDKTKEEIAQINDWLFNRDNFLPLEILQDDMEGYVFYCKLINPRHSYVGGINVSWVCEMECNSPYAWKKNGKLYTITNTSPISIQNQSMKSGYTYPNVEIKSSSNNGTVRITNNTLGEYFEIEHLSMNEVVNINKVHLITTSLGSGINKVKDTNMKFPRLIRGDNSITVTGNFSYVKLGFDEAIKVGG